MHPPGLEPGADHLLGDQLQHRPIQCQQPIRRIRIGARIHEQALKFAAGEHAVIPCAIGFKGYSSIEAMRKKLGPPGKVNSNHFAVRVGESIHYLMGRCETGAIPWLRFRPSYSLPPSLGSIRCASFCRVGFLAL